LPILGAAPTHKLCKMDFMPLLNKVGGKLLGWNGKLMTKEARAQLVKSVLTSILTYHATVFPLPKWLIKKLTSFVGTSSRKGKM
jgi:hypothetical protein